MLTLKKRKKTLILFTFLQSSEVQIKIMVNKLTKIPGKKN